MSNQLMMRGAALALILFPIAACALPADQQSTAPRKVGAAGSGVTPQVFIQRHERKLMADDTDGDGKISRAEFLAAAKAGKGDPAKRFAKMDRNGDGLLDKAEINATLTRQFQRLDANGDGVISAAERAAARPGKNGLAGKEADS